MIKSFRIRGASIQKEPITGSRSGGNLLTSKVNAIDKSVPRIEVRNEVSWVVLPNGSRIQASLIGA